MCTVYYPFIKSYFRLLEQLSYLAWRCRNNGINMKAYPNPTDRLYVVIMLVITNKHFVIPSYFQKNFISEYFMTLK